MQLYGCSARRGTLQMSHARTARHRATMPHAGGEGSSNGSPSRAVARGGRDAGGEEPSNGFP